MEKHDATSAPALGFSLTCNLDGNRQLVFQSFVAADAPAGEVNAAVDKIMAITDRQRAKYEIITLQKDRADLDRDIVTGEEAVDGVEANFRKATAALDVQLLEINRLIAAENEGAAALAAQRGQSVKAALKGRSQQNIDRAHAGIAQVQTEKIRQAAEREAALTEFNKTQDRRRVLLASMDVQITEKQALIDG